MRRRWPWAIAVLAALVVAALGIDGAYSYGDDYNLHRGFTPVKRVPGAQAGRLLKERFYSPALHRRAVYWVYLPPGYTPRRRYPVYYLLQGEPSDPLTFVNVADMDTRLDDLIAEHRARPMLLVYPDGRIDGRYFSDSEWANTPSGDYETSMIETVRNVDARFSTIDRRSGRVLAGFSMGAYGAMNIGLHHLALFASIQAWSGYYIETHNGVFAHASPRTMAYNSPGEYITHLRRTIDRHPLQVFMYTGRVDANRPEQNPMARALREAGAHAGTAVYPGGHNWALWYPQLDPMIELASRELGHPPGRVHVSPGTRIQPVPYRLQFVADRILRRGAAKRRRQRERRRAMHEFGSSGPGGVHGSGARVLRGASPRRSSLSLIAALVLALIAAAFINLGFVLQHRGHAQARRQGSARLLDVIRTPHWLLGQLVGWAGWAGQIVAVALAPLTLVQAFGAGGLALSVPLAAWLFHHRVGRAQGFAILAIGLALASLPLGAGTHGHLRDGLLIGISLLLCALAALGCLIPRAAARAIAAGVLYGVADGAIKADAFALHHGGLSGLLGGWTVIAALATFGGFLAFQSSLRTRSAVAPLSLMAALSAVTGVAIGVAAFGEPLGSSVASGAVHLAAIGVVLACVPLLVRTQQELVAEEPAVPDTVSVPDAPPVSAEVPVDAVGPGSRIGRGAGLVMARTGGVLAGIVGVCAGTGLLYSLRGLHWFGAGPHVADALPLLQLANFSGQPLLRVIVAWAATGLALGVALARLPVRSRLAVLAPVAVPLLLIASDACFALARNDGLFGVLPDRAPGLGPWLECLLLIGAAVVVPVALARHRDGAPEPGPRRALDALAPATPSPAVPAQLQSPSSRP